MQAILREKAELSIRCQTISGERDAALAESDGRQLTITEVIKTSYALLCLRILPCERIFTWGHLLCFILLELHGLDDVQFNPER